MKGYPSTARPSLKVSTSIRSGAAAWARRNWHWLIIVVGLSKATQWTAQKSWRAGRWAGRTSVRVAKWSAPRVVRASRRGGRALQARMVHTADALTAYARSKGQTTVADRPTPVMTMATQPMVAHTHTGGMQMATQETQALARAASAVGQMDPGTAWDLDAQLAGMSTASLVLAENIGQYIETLNNIKTDPRVTAQAANAVAQLAELCKMFATARQTFRALYAPQFEAAENGVRHIQRQGFFDPRNSSAA